LSYRAENKEQVPAQIFLKNKIAINKVRTSWQKKEELPCIIPK
jgi:hypothetical protein